MSLGWKLFVSYVIVVIVGAAVLVVSTASLGPVTFSQHLQSMNEMMSGGMMMDPSRQLQAELDANFRQALNETLLFAALAATVVAGIVSVYISRRIVKPIRDTVRASERIADGHYQERLTLYSADELGELTETFNRMAEALEETEAMRQQLIADISHELKTPLTGIQAYMEGLQDGIMQPGPETYQQVQMEAARLQRLVRDLQELSRAESEQFALHPAASDASDLIRAAADWIRPQFQDGDIELSINLPDRPITVLADPDRIRQVLLNLLGNALQYTPSGGQVTVTLQQKDRQAFFSVRDTGIGLADEDLKRIFQRFYRVDKSRARASGGSGIGLTISQAIIRAHNGSLWAESDGPDQGSTFFFTLPLAA